MAWEEPDARSALSSTAKGHASICMDIYSTLANSIPAKGHDLKFFSSEASTSIEWSVLGKMDIQQILPSFSHTSPTQSIPWNPTG